MEKKPLFNFRHIAITGIFFACFTALINVSPWGLAGLLEISNGQTILDMYSSGYTPDLAYEVFEKEGEAGRSFELRYIVPLDFIFPISYGLFYAISLIVFASVIFPRLKNPGLFAIPGILATSFDLTENILKVIMLRNYPARLDTVAHAANFFTIGKFSLVVLCMVMFVMGGSVVLIKKLIKK